MVAGSDMVAAQNRCPEAMPDDEKTKGLVRLASRVVIAAGAIAAVVSVGTGGFFLWRHIAYQQTVKRCTLGLPAETVNYLEGLNARLDGTTEGPMMRCIRSAGF
jgi:hypothetical protein